MKDGMYVMCYIVVFFACNLMKVTDEFGVGENRTTLA